MRQTTVLGLLACVLAATGMVTVQATRQSDSFTNVAFADALGAPKPDAPLARRPAEGVKVRIDRKGFQVAGEHGRVSIASAAPSSSRWARYAHGAARPTSFGRETVVVTPEKTEQFLTVERRQGPKTWQWQLGSAGKIPRVGDDGAIAFLGGHHKLAPMHVEPVAILDERGNDITPEGLRWSVAQGRHGWVLEAPARRQQASSSVRHRPGRRLPARAAEQQRRCRCREHHDDDAGRGREQRPPVHAHRCSRRQQYDDRDSRRVDAPPEREQRDVRPPRDLLPGRELRAGRRMPSPSGARRHPSRRSARSPRTTASSPRRHSA